METEAAPEAATRHPGRDVPDVAAALAGRLDLGDAGAPARASSSGAEASASAEDGDVVGEAEVRWAR